MIKLPVICLLFSMLAVMPHTSRGQINLTIEIDKLRNNDGQVLLEFNNEKGERMMGITQKIEDSKCTISVKNLMPGKYAFKYFHDENNNNNIDVNWLGIPKEGYGFSNNANGTFGPPPFKKMIFEIKGDTILKDTPTYITF